MEMPVQWRALHLWSPDAQRLLASTDRGPGPRQPSVQVAGPVCFGFWQLLTTKSYCELLNTQLFSQLL
jgi:hypothetical protein